MSRRRTCGAAAVLAAALFGCGGLALQGHAPVAVSPAMERAE